MTPARLPRNLPLDDAGLVSLVKTGRALAPRTGPLYPPESRRGRPCFWLGAKTGETVTCGTCAGRTELDVLACGLGGECLPTQLTDGRRCCATCDEYRPQKSRPSAIAAGPVAPLAPAPGAKFPPVTTRHLLYHVYPVAGNGAWQRNVASLVSRLRLFNGKKVVAVVTDPPTGRVPESRVPGAPDGYRHFGACDSPDAVRAAFGRYAADIEFVILPNDPDRRETATFHPLFSRVEETDPTHATFYGQAKGVTRPLNHTAHEWADALHAVYLDYFPLVQAALATHPVAGAFRKLGAGWQPYQSRSQWHYSGAFLWFRNAELFARNWQKIDPFWGGMESYPAVHFDAHEAGVLFYAAATRDMNLYNGGYWQTTVRPALARFHAAHAHQRLACAPEDARLNFGCGPFYAAGWHNTDVVQSDTIRPDVVLDPKSPLPYPDGQFARIYAGHVMEHVPWVRVVPTLTELRRVLRPGGELTVVGPDLHRALARLTANPADAAALRHVWEVVEDDSHYQYTSPGEEWDGARHQWNAYAGRVARALSAAGFRDVAEVPYTREQMGEWPCVDFTAMQSAVRGVK